MINLIFFISAFFLSMPVQAMQNTEQDLTILTNSITALEQTVENDLSFASIGVNNISTTQTTEMTIKNDTASALFKARIGAHASLGISLGVMSWLIFKTFRDIYSYAATHYLSFLKEYEQKVVNRGCLLATVPFALICLIQYGPILDYFFYILYSGERVSPLLARNVLYDMRIYLEHIQTLKEVKQQLLVIIDQLAELEIADSGKNVLPVHLSCQAGTLTSSTIAKNSLPGVSSVKYGVLISFVKKIEKLIVAHERLRAHFHDDLFKLCGSCIMYEQEHSLKILNDCHTVAVDLKDETQAVMTQLQGAVNGLGAHTQIISDLLSQLIEYWQRYADSLALSVKNSIEFCKSVHTIEDFIVNVLVRPLVSL